MSRIEIKKGFTLMELLIVVAIIGILSSIVLASLNAARMKSRDAKRYSDIKQIQTALELYYNENGRYPTTAWISSNAATWQTFLGSALGMNLPVDPTNTATGQATTAGVYTYSYYSRAYGCEGQWYMIVYRLEGDSTPVSQGVQSCTTYFNYGGTMTVGANSVM